MSKSTVAGRYPFRSGNFDPASMTVGLSIGEAPVLTVRIDDDNNDDFWIEARIPLAEIRRVLRERKEGDVS